MDYHRSLLIEPARTKGFGIDDGNRISDLQLLAKLQHFGAATGLLDFTWDPLVALWFACKKDEIDEQEEYDGRVFTINLNDPIKFQRVNSEADTQNVQSIFSPVGISDKQLYWEPMIRGEAAPRILRQRSVFVIGRPLIPEDIVKSIDIKASDKAVIRKELEEIFDISERTIFTDIQGFSQVNGPKSLLQQFESPSYYLYQGNQFYQQGSFQDAVSNYDRCIGLDSEVSETYFLRGNAKAELENYTGAERDYDLAIQYKDRPFLWWNRDNFRVTNPILLWQTYFNRGNAKAESNDYEGALADYNEAIRLSQQAGLEIPSLLFNKGNANVMSHKLRDAIDDYDKAISLGVSEAYFNKGNALVMLGCFEEALQCYDEGISNGNDRTGLIGNRNHVQAILEWIGGLDYKVPSPKYDTSVPLMTIDVSVCNADDSTFTRFPVFQGIVGNIGNLGGNGLRGGSGFSGKDGFVVRLRSQDC